MGRENSLINDILKKNYIGSFGAVFLFYFYYYFISFWKKNYVYGEFFLTVLHLVRQKYGPVCQKDIADIGQ